MSTAWRQLLEEEADHRRTPWSFILAVALWIVVPVAVWVPVVAYLVFGWSL